MALAWLRPLLRAEDNSVGSKASPPLKTIVVQSNKSPPLRSQTVPFEQLPKGFTATTGIAYTTDIPAGIAMVEAATNLPIAEYAQVSQALALGLKPVGTSAPSTGLVQLTDRFGNDWDLSVAGDLRCLTCKTQKSFRFSPAALSLFLKPPPQLIQSTALLSFTKNTDLTSANSIQGTLRFAIQNSPLRGPAAKAEKLIFLLNPLKPGTPPARIASITFPTRIVKSINFRVISAN